MNPEEVLEQIELIADSEGGVDTLRHLLLVFAYSGKFSQSGNDDDWMTLPVENLVERLNPGAACGKQHLDDDGYVHLRTHNIDTSGRMNFDLIIRVDPSKIESKKSTLKKGDVIFNNTNSRELVGKTCLVDSDYDYAYSNHLTLIRVNNLISPEYLVGYFNLLWRRGLFADICKKWIGQAGISTKMLKKIEVRFPKDRAAQDQITDRLSNLMDLCNTLEDSKSTTNDLLNKFAKSAQNTLIGGE